MDFWKNRHLLWKRWLGIRDLIISHELLLAVVAALLLIASGLLLSLESNKVIPSNIHQVSRYTQEPHNPLRFLAGWDGPIYIGIAQAGYVKQNDPAFFPLYPLLIRGVNKISSSPLDSALTIAWASLVGAIYFYLRVAKRLFAIKDNREALRATLLFVLFPTGVFLLASYTESLFAFLALGSIYYALSKRPLPAAIFAMFATAAHVNGVFVVVLMALLLYEQRVRLRQIALSVIIGCLGLLAYMAYLVARYHNPLQFVAVQHGNGWLQKSSYLQHLLANFDIFNLVTFLLIAVAVIYWWNRRRSFSIYAALYLCIPLIGGQFKGFNRYALMAFPVQFMLYERFRKGKVAYPLVVAIFAMYWGFYMLELAGGYTGG